MPNEVKGTLFYNRKKDEIGLLLNLHVVDNYEAVHGLNHLVESEYHDISYFISFDDGMELQMEEKSEEWLSSDWQKYHNDVNKVFQFFKESQNTCVFAEKLIEFSIALWQNYSFPIADRINIFSYIKDINDVLIPCAEFSKKSGMVRNWKIARRRREENSEDYTMQSTEENKSTIARYIGPTVKMKSKSLQNNEFYLVTLRTDEYAYVIDENNLKVFVNINVLDFGENNLEKARSSCLATNDVPLAQIEEMSDVESLPKEHDKYTEKDELVKDFVEATDEDISKMLMEALKEMSKDEMRSFDEDDDELAHKKAVKKKKKKKSVFGFYFPDDDDDDEEKATRIVGKVSEWAEKYGKTDSDIFHSYTDDDDDSDDDDDDDDDVDNGDSPLGLWNDNDDDEYGNGDYSDHDDGEDDEGDVYY